MAFTATQEQLDRYVMKAGLGQAEVIATAQDDIELRYQRFDSDTGARVDDETTDVDYAAIVAERNRVQAQVAERQARLDQLAVVVAYLDSIIPD